MMLCCIWVRRIRPRILSEWHKSISLYKCTCVCVDIDNCDFQAYFMPFLYLLLSHYTCVVLLVTFLQNSSKSKIRRKELKRGKMKSCSENSTDMKTQRQIQSVKQDLYMKTHQPQKIQTQRPNFNGESAIQTSNLPLTGQT